MRSLTDTHVAPFRDRRWETEIMRLNGDAAPRPLDGYDATVAGCFVVPSCIDAAPLRCVVSCEPSTGWEHVSVSRKKRVPNWYEMEQVKRLFFRDEEYAFQLHVPSSEHISLHPNCLHLWRPLDAFLPIPPASMVGFAPSGPSTP